MKANSFLKTVVCLGLVYLYVKYLSDSISDLDTTLVVDNGWSSENANIAQTAASLFFNISAIVLFLIGVKNLYYSFPGVVSVFVSDGNAVTHTENIDRIKGFREGAMSSMTSAESAELYKKTAWLDGLSNNDGPNVRRAKGFANAKLGTMDNKDGLDWLKGDKK